MASYLPFAVFAVAWIVNGNTFFASTARVTKPFGLSLDLKKVVEMDKPEDFPEDRRFLPFSNKLDFPSNANFVAQFMQVLSELMGSSLVLGGSGGAYMHLGNELGRFPRDLDIYTSHPWEAHTNMKALRDIILQGGQRLKVAHGDILGQIAKKLVEHFQIKDIKVYYEGEFGSKNFYCTYWVEFQTGKTLEMDIKDAKSKVISDGVSKHGVPTMAISDLIGNLRSFGAESERNRRHSDYIALSSQEAKAKMLQSKYKAKNLQYQKDQTKQKRKL